MILEKAKKNPYSFNDNYCTRKDRRNLEYSYMMGRGRTKKWLKRLLAKKVRRYKHKLPNGNAYRKILDIPYILF